MIVRYAGSTKGYDRASDLGRQRWLARLRQATVRAGGSGWFHDVGRAYDLTMEETLFENDGLTLTKRNGRFFVRYDAGSHQIALREDEITPSEADRVMQGHREAEEVLFALQGRIAAAGGDPYRSNLG